MRNDKKKESGILALCISFLTLAAAIYLHRSSKPNKDIKPIKNNDLKSLEEMTDGELDTFLNHVISMEEYEVAAVLRDEINKRKSLKHA